MVQLAGVPLDTAVAVDLLTSVEFSFYRQQRSHTFYLPTSQPTLITT
jgi:hypothetical protein